MAGKRFDFSVCRVCPTIKLNGKRFPFQRPEKYSPPCVYTILHQLNAERRWARGRNGRGSERERKNVFQSINLLVCVSRNYLRSSETQTINIAGGLLTNMRSTLQCVVKCRNAVVVVVVVGGVVFESNRIFSFIGIK